MFIENEVDRVALYGEMDAAHMIGFQAVNNKVLFENSVVEKVPEFQGRMSNSQKESDNTRSRSIYLPWICLLWRLEFFDDLFSK